MFHSDLRFAAEEMQASQPVMPWAGRRLNLPDPCYEMMVCYSGAENQSLLVLKKLQLGEPNPDVLSEHSTLYKPVETS